MDSLNLKIIARIKSDFPEKFGVPRQSGLAPALRSVIRFEPEFRKADALRGLDGFSHLWIIWIFSENVEADSAPAAAWREYATRGVRHPEQLQAEPDCDELRKNRGNPP